MAVTTLDTLPVELIEHIASFIPHYSTLLALSWTSRPFYLTLHDSPSSRQLLQRYSSTPPGRSIPTSDLLVIETWPAFSPTPHPSSSHEFRPPADVVPRWASTQVRENKYACKLCRRLRPPEAFTGGMISGKRGKGRPGATERFCVGCGVASQRYQKGQLLYLGLPAEGGLGKPDGLDFSVEDGVGKSSLNAGGHAAAAAAGIVCKRCGKFRAVPAQSREGIRRLCGDCLKYRPSDGRVQVWDRGLIEGSA